MKDFIMKTPIFARTLCAMSKWSDIRFHKEYRLQKSIHNNYRILSPKFESIYGTKEDLLLEFEKIKNKNPICETKTCVLIHGYANTNTVMMPLQKYLEENNYYTINIRYSSMYSTLNELTEIVNELISNLEGPLHIIGHSLGGLISTNIANTNPQKIKNIILIGSPINGSETAKKTMRFPGAIAMSGPILKDLIGGVEIKRNNIGVISAFTNGIHKSALLKDINDGVVALKETIPNCPHDHFMIEEQHTNVVKNSRVIEKCHHFLEKNYF